MKFLVCGCNGMAGHTISLYLKEQGHDVLGFDLKKSVLIDSIAGNAMDREFIADLIGNGGFDSIVNCIGILNQTADENKALAAYLNSYWPHMLADLTANSNTQIIHMSTDCVFSGKKGKYTEADITDGETFYDRSKALGELNDRKNLTLRNSIVGPDINPEGIGLLNWFMKQTGPINGYKKAIWTGQTTLQLAKTIEYAAKTKAHGLVNAVPDSSICKYDLLQLFNKYIREDSIEIKAIDGINADKSLVRTNFEMDYLIPSYEEMIKEMSEWMQNHENLYPHYKIKHFQENIK